MFKMVVMRVITLVCLLSFPASSFGSGPMPETSTGISTPINGNYSILRGTATGESISEYGFEYGETTQYGSTTSSSRQLLDVATLIENGSISFGSSGDPNDELGYVEGISRDSEGNIFVVDANNDAIRKYSSTGKFLLKFGTTGTDPGQFNRVGPIAIDSDDNVYLGDMYNNRVQKFDTQGNFINLINSDVSGENFHNPMAIALDADDNLYIADSWISKYDSNGNHIAEIASDGYGSEHSSFGGIDIDNSGNIFTSEMNSSTVRKYGSDGILINSFDTTYNNHQNINYTGSINLDSSGNIFVTDEYDRRIQVYSPTGTYIGETNPSESWSSIYIADDDTIYYSGYSGIGIYALALEPGTFSAQTDLLQCNTQYHYRSYATNENGTSYGQDSTIDTGDCPDGPENVLASPTGRTVTLSWSSDTDPDVLSHYLIEYKKSSDSNWTEQHTLMDQDAPNTGTIAGLEPQTQYDFRIALVSGNQNSGMSNSNWSDTTIASTASVSTYQISTCEQFESIGVNPDTYVTGDQEGIYLLANDIDCSQSHNWTWKNVEIDDASIEVEGFLPIMKPDAIGGALHGFRGELNGNDHSISNISQSSYVYSGVFYSLQGAYIHDIAFDNLSIQINLPRGYIGGLAATSEGNVKIEDVSINGDLTSVVDTRPHLANIHISGGIAVAPNGHIFIGDFENVIETDDQGIEINRFSGDFHEVTDLDIDGSGNIFVTDRSSQNVYKYDSEGTLLGTVNPDTSGSNPGSFPMSSAIAPNGDIYIAGWSESHPLQKFDSSFNLLNNSTQYGQDPGQLSQAYGVAINLEGHIFVTDNSRKISEFDSNLNYVSGFSSPVPSYDFGYNIAFDQQGNFYVGTSVAGVVLKLNAEREFLNQIGPTGVRANYGFMGLGVDSQGNVYKSNPLNYHVELYDTDGNFSRRIGTSNNLESELTVGGLIGYSGFPNQTTPIAISKSSVDMSINLENGQPLQPTVTIGGVIGSGINQTVSSGDITTTGGILYFVGGIAGYFAGSIIDSHTNNIVNISGSEINTIVNGGLAASARIEELTDDNFIIHESNIENSYSAGTLTLAGGNDAEVVVGGIAGMYQGSTFKNVFSARTNNINMDRSTNGMNVPVSGLVGMIMVDADAVINNAFDVTLAGTDICFGMLYSFLTGPGDASGLDCNLANVDGNDPDHFKNNNQVEPLVDWNFDQIWLAEAGVYPQLKVKGISVNHGPDENPGANESPVDTPNDNPNEVVDTANGSNQDSSANADNPSRGKALNSGSSKPILGQLSLTGSNSFDAAILSLNLIVLGFVLVLLVRGRSIAKNLRSNYK